MRHEHGAMCRANLEEMKLKASYVDADCIKDMDKADRAARRVDHSRP
jgi:hypothetical protein